jgi:hypothetical protein
LLSGFSTVRFLSAQAGTGLYLHKKKPPRLILCYPDLPFGHSLKCRRFFRTEKEAARYVSYLHTIYAGRTVPASFLSHGQLSLF